MAEFSQPSAAAPITLYYWNRKARSYAASVVAQAGGLEIDFKGDFELPELKKELPFGQVPYLVHGDVKVAQSNAILRYLGRLGKLNGDNDAEFAFSEMLIEEAADVFNLGRLAHYATNYQTPKVPEAFPKLFAADGALAKQLAYLEPIISADDKFLTGHYALASSLDILICLNGQCLDAFPKVKAFYIAMIALPAFAGIKDWPNYFQLPQD